MKMKNSNLKSPIFLPLFICCFFVAFKMQTSLAASDTKKSFPIISKKCPINLFCYLKDSILYVGKEIPVYDSADGKIIDEIKRNYIKVLDFQLHTYSDRKTKIWLHVKTADRKKFWVLQNYDDMAVAEPLSEENIESLKNDNPWFKKKLTEQDLLKKIKTEDFNLSAHFNVQKIFNDMYPVFKQGIISFSKDLQSNYNDSFFFKNCSALTKILREKMDYETVGTDPFQVRYNRIFIENENKLVTDSFTKRCRAFVDENSAICPTSGSYFETLVSKVGSLVSIEYGDMMSAGCGPVYTSSLFKSIDLKTGKEAQLTDFFDEADLVKALQQDSIIQENFKYKKIEDQNTLEKLSKTLNIYGFAIYEEKIRTGRLRIRVAIRASQLHWTGYTLIGIDVKPKKDFMTEFKNLDPKKELFLAKTAKSLNALEGSNAN